MKKLRHRSKIRIIIGKLIFRSFRYYDWYFGKKRFANEINNSLLEFGAFQHQTPLIRHLRSVDMWMQYNKVDNLKIAVNKVNRVIVKPGETFSYWKLIGKPSKRKGYKKGMVLNQGKFEAGIGGGLCQLSNLIYWISIHTELVVTERYRHSYDVFPDASRTQPFGSGATCVYNYRDLQIYNPTEYNYQLCLKIDDENSFGEWRTSEPLQMCFEVFEKNHRIEHIFGDYIRRNELYRNAYNLKGELVYSEFIISNDAKMMYQPLLGEKT